MDRGPRGIRVRIVSRLYPSAWRARYGVEMAAVLDERPPTWGDTVDLARGAVDAHLHPEGPSRLPARAALLAGAAWTLVAMAYLAEPVPPDWPGYLAWTLVPGMVGALAGLIAALGMALRLGDAPDRLGRGATIGVSVTGAAWVASLAWAAAGGAYGAATAATGVFAAISMVALGWALIGHRESGRGLALVIIGGAFVLPPPAAWAAAAVTWSAVGLWMVLATTRPTGHRVAS